MCEPGKSMVVLCCNEYPVKFNLSRDIMYTWKYADKYAEYLGIEVKKRDTWTFETYVRV